MPREKSIFVIGPTASGKSDLAITLAKKYDGEVISSDSRQIYRGMDIGSGKEPGKMTSSAKRGPHTRDAYMIQGIPHYMIDTHHPNTIYSADKFVRKSQNIQNDIWSRDHLPIIAGGTMFWAQGLVEGSVGASVPPNPTLRHKYASYTPERLLKLLQKKDPVRAQSIIDHNEINNKVRLIRSLEIIDALGAVPPPKKVDYKEISRDTLILAITPDQDVLYERIEKRMDCWFRDGIFEEVIMLHHDMNVPWTRIESFGLEYKWSVQYVRGMITMDEMRHNTIRDLKHYAKRQLTWIRRWERHGAQIHHIKNAEHATGLVNNFLSLG